MKATIVGIAPRNNSAKLNVSLNVNILGRHGQPGNYVIDERNYIGVRQRFINRIIASIAGNSIDGFTLAEAASTVVLSLNKRDDKIKFFNQVLRGAIIDIEAVQYSAGEVLSFEEVEEVEGVEESETDETTDETEDIVANYDGVYYKVANVVITDLAKKIIGVRFTNAMTV